MSLACRWMARTDGPADGGGRAHGCRDPVRRDPRLPSVPRSRLPEHRARRRRLADDDRWAPDPRRVLGRRDGVVSRVRRAGDHRGRRGASRTALVLLQPPLHERAAGAAGRSSVGGRGAGDGAGPTGLRRFRGERDGAAARAAVPRGAGRHRSLARDLAGAVLPRVDDGHAGAHRPTRAPGAVHAVPRVPPPHPALDVAHRPERRGGARGARPAPRGGRTGDRRRVLLRAGRRGGPAGRRATGSVLGGPRGAPGGARVPDLLRRGRDGDRPGRELARRGSAADRAGHRRDRQGSRRRLRAARRGRSAGSTSTTRSIEAPASSTSGTRGTAPRCRRPWGWPCWISSSSEA